MAMLVFLCGVVAFSVGSSPPHEYYRRPPIRSAGVRFTRGSSVGTSGRPAGSTSTTRPPLSRLGATLAASRADTKTSRNSIAAHSVQIEGGAECPPLVLLRRLDDAAMAQRWLLCLIARRNLTLLLAQLRQALCARTRALFGAQKTYAQSACASFLSASDRSGVQRPEMRSAAAAGGRANGSGGELEAEGGLSAHSNRGPKRIASSKSNSEFRMNANSIVIRSLEGVSRFNSSRRQQLPSIGIGIGTSLRELGHTAEQSFSDVSFQSRNPIASRQSSERISGAIARVRRNFDVTANIKSFDSTSVKQTTSKMLVETTSERPTGKASDISSVCSEEEERATLCEFGDCVRIPYISIAVCRCLPGFVGIACEQVDVAWVLLEFIDLLEAEPVSSDAKAPLKGALAEQVSFMSYAPL